MKRTLKKTSIILALPIAAAVLSSCASTPVYGNVEEVSRRSPTTPLPYTGEDTYVPAAIEYSRGRVPEQTININRNDDYGNRSRYDRGYRY